MQGRHISRTGQEPALRRAPLTLIIAVTTMLAAVLASSVLTVGAGTGATRRPGPTRLTGTHATSSSAIALGAFVSPTGTQGSTQAAVLHLESTIGRNLAVINSFSDWQDQTGRPVAFPVGLATFASSVGAVPMVTWQPEHAPAPGTVDANQPSYSLAQLASGRYDAYITSWADQAKAYGGPVYVRLMHEMNGNWYPWGYNVNGNSGPQQYIAAWQHIVDSFRSVGADNVQFVWCGSSSGHADPALYFPGDRYASWIALDGYNRGTIWQTLTQVFATPYAQITAVSKLPVMLAEIGTVEQPGVPNGKASWITSGFESEIPQNFPRVHAALYFDSPGAGFDWSLTSSAEAMAAFTQVGASANYQGTLPPPTPSPPPPPATPPAPTASGYDLVGADGGVFVFGNGFYGSLPGLGVHVDDVTGIVPTAAANGYFLVGADGGVFAFHAPFANSLPGIGIHVHDVVGIVPTLDNQGYFLVGQDGGVFSFNAPFENSLPGVGVRVDNIVGIASTADDRGYWLVGSDGSVYAFGDAHFFGSAPTGAVTIVATRDGGGYWVLGSDGTVTPFGDARSFGDLAASGVAVHDIVGMVASPDDFGYNLIGRDGGVFSFGDAVNRGSLPGVGVHVDDVVGAVPA